MTKTALSDALKKDFLSYLKRKRKPDLVTNYLFFVEKRDKLSPIACPRHKMIFRNLEEATTYLEKAGRLWREIRIHIGHEIALVNEQTQKIYICPFSGKVFGDNTHPNPQDAIYDWVSKCPENTERKDGLVVKRFFVSEDLEIIKNYIEKPVEPITKVVFASSVTGTLYQNKETIVEEFKEKYVKPISLEEIQNQNRFEIEPQFLEYIQDQLAETAMTEFVENLAEHEEFMPYIQKWLES